MPDDLTVRNTPSASKLLTWIDACAYLEDLSNAALAALLVDLVWAQLPLMSPASDLISEAIDRLQDAG